MKMNKIKLIALLLFATTTLGIFNACSGGNNKSENSSKSGTSTLSSAEEIENKSSENDNTDKTGSSSESRESSQADDPTDEKEKGSVPAIPTSDDNGQVIEGIIVYNKALFERFYGYDDLANDYADTMLKIHTALGNDVKIYNVLVPTHCGISLPDSVVEENGLEDQNEYINTIIKKYSADSENPIVGINTYDTLMHHRDEYIYLNTDHHWSALGAYYAYKDFCKAAGVDYLRLSDMEKGEINDYYGSLTAYVDSSYVDPDTVEYYKTNKDITTKVYENDGSGGTDTSLIHSYADSSFAYGVFLGGDNGLMVSKNNDGNGKKIAVVKESYGNAFCPYIAYTYSETHMIDFRYITFDFEQYLKDNDIHEVIFINNAMATATPARCEELSALVSE